MFQTRNRLVAALAIAMVAGSGTSHASSRDPIPTSICTVLSRPADWNNKNVSLSASYYGDGFFGGALVDNHCDDSVLEVAIVWNSQAQAELKAALLKARLGSFGNVVSGTWVGRFHSNYGKFHGTFLEVRAIANLSVLPIDFSISDASPISTTLGEIVNHPKAFNQKTVVFRSELMSDLHGSIVFECVSKGVARGIKIRSTIEAKGEETLDRALQQGLPGTLDKTISAEWTGRLVWFPRPGSSGYEIQIVAIEHLTSSLHPAEAPCESEAASASSPQP
jgi:hypothetical protein